MKPSLTTLYLMVSAFLILYNAVSLLPGLETEAPIMDLSFGALVSKHLEDKASIFWDFLS